MIYILKPAKLKIFQTSSGKEYMAAYTAQVKAVVFWNIIMAEI